MASETSENVAVGEIIGYGRELNPFSKNSRVIVKAKDRIIRVPIDNQQLKYFRKVRRIGDKVAVGFYGGAWHVGIPPAASIAYGAKKEIGELELLQYELEGLDLLELTLQHTDLPAAELLQDGEPDNAIDGNDMEDLKQKAVINLLLSEINERRDYIKRVENDIRKTGEQQSSLEALPPKPLQADAPEDEEGPGGMEDLKQKAVINLLLSDIDDHRDYLREVEDDIKNNSEKILSDLGLSHLGKDYQKKILLQGKDGIKTLDKQGYNKRLELIIIQNNEILLKLDEVIYLLQESMAK